jgi:hypothetical protein
VGSWGVAAASRCLCGSSRQAGPRRATHRAHLLAVGLLPLIGVEGVLHLLLGGCGSGDAQGLLLAAGCGAAGGLEGTHRRGGQQARGGHRCGAGGAAARAAAAADGLQPRCGAEHSGGAVRVGGAAEQFPPTPSEGLGALRLCWTQGVEPIDAQRRVFAVGGLPAGLMVVVGSLLRMTRAVVAQHSAQW